MPLAGSQAALAALCRPAPAKPAVTALPKLTLVTPLGTGSNTLRCSSRGICECRGRIWYLWLPVTAPKGCGLRPQMLDTCHLPHMQSTQHQVLFSSLGQVTIKDSLHTHTQENLDSYQNAGSFPNASAWYR